MPASLRPRAIDARARAQPVEHFELQEAFFRATFELRGLSPRPRDWC
jgi:hypothetical protein